MKKHNCEQWRDEGRGCALCSRLLSSITQGDINYHKYTAKAEKILREQLHQLEHKLALIKQIVGDI